MTHDPTSPEPPTDAVRVGLVLGAGGAVGIAHHAGVLLSLHHHLGWDARTADVVVGSSAGSVTGALLRAGVAPEDLAALLVDAPFVDDELAKIITALPSAPSPGLVHFVRALRPPGPRTVARVARNLGRARPMAAFGSGMRGSVRLSDALGPLRQLTGDAWPDQPLWLTAVGPDGGLAVFGREDPMPSLSDAVAASCAVPGLFAPVVIDGDRYVDGGAHSPTNADVLADQALDIVIISSPMSARAGAEAGRWDARARRLFHTWVEQEAERLRHGGTEVVLIEPAEGLLHIMGTNAMASGRSGAVLREAFLETGDLLRRTSFRAPLAPLAASARPLR